VPDIVGVAEEMVGFCNEEVKPPGPLHVYELAEGVFNCIVPPAHKLPVLEAVVENVLLFVTFNTTVSVHFVMAD
jgi:hypothetical protein